VDPWSAPIWGRARRARIMYLIAAIGICGVAALGAGCAAGQLPPALGSTPTIVTTTPQSNSTLTGKWRDEKSNIYEFVSSGTDSYSGQVVDAAGGVCTPININVSASARHFEGTMAFYKVVDSKCDAYLGDGTIAIALNEAGSTAQVTWAGPAAGGNCLNCTPHTWTRQP
jgi:hypothetical protein